jgi:broad specificity phosphatase PhoE
VVDFRVVEQLLLKYQQQNVDHIMAITEQWSDDATYGETQKQVYQRVYKSINEIIKTSNHATIIIATHADPVLATTMIFK